MKTTRKFNAKKGKPLNLSENAQGELSKSLKANSELRESFAKAFFLNLVKEADEEEVESSEDGKGASPDDFTKDKNEADFNNNLEPTTDAEDFQTQGTDPMATANVISSIKEWSLKLGEFAKFMNSPESQSLHQILASEDRPGSLLKGVTRKASDSITRIAGEIEKLKEVLNSFIIMAPKKQRDSDQQNAAGVSPGGAAPAAAPVPQA